MEKRTIIQLSTNPDADVIALANDGTTWWWNPTSGGWNELYDELPQPTVQGED